MPEVKIHLELTLPLARVTVNVMMALFQQLLARLVPQLVATWLTAWQEHELEQVLGPAWAKPSQTPAGWACPRCQSTHGFQRRGSRPRVLRHTCLGRLAFALRQVTCQTCGATFTPFASPLGLAPYQTSTSEYQAYAVQMACQVSYARSAQQVSQAPLTSAVSGSAIHAWVQACGPQVQFEPSAAEGHPLVLDGTRVKAGDNQRGTALNLGVTLTERTRAGGRAQLSKRVVAFGVDELGAPPSDRWPGRSPVACTLTATASSARHLTRLDRTGRANVVCGICPTRCTIRPMATGCPRPTASRSKTACVPSCMT